jgi:hypothetical protein
MSDDDLMEERERCRDLCRTLKDENTQLRARVAIADQTIEELTPLVARVADLAETIKAIRAVNVTEFGTVGDEAVERLISSCAAIDAAKETDK